MKMKRYIYSGLMSAMLIGWGCMMTCCSSSGDSDEQSDAFTLRVGSVTRTGDEETLDPNPLPWGDIHLYMLPQEGGASQSGTITYNGIDDNNDIIWNATRLEVKPGRDYYIFGFMPAGIGSNNTVTVNSETSATMNFYNLPAVTDQDICVIVGVKEGKTQLGISDQGSFVYHAPENTSEGYFVSLLADHLYASVEFRVTIDTEYNVLRKVMLKKMTLKCKEKDKATQNLVVHFTMNDVGTHPIVETPTSSPQSAATENVKDLYDAGEGSGEELSTQFKSFTGYFAEACAEDLSIECEYDIYDRVSGDNNKIETRTVVNGLKSLLKNLKRGQKKVINLTVDPTYLYQLSDGDVDR